MSPELLLYIPSCKVSSLQNFTNPSLQENVLQILAENSDPDSLSKQLQ